MSRKQIKDEDLAYAKELYMAYEPISSIARKLSIPRDSLKYHVSVKKDCWKHEREGIEKEVLKEFNGTKRAKLVNISKLSLSILEKSLVDMGKQDRVSLQEARNVATILDSMDKIIKLDEGKPTERKELIDNRPTSPQELKERLKQADPFLQFEENDEKIDTSPASDTDIKQ